MPKPRPCTRPGPLIALGLLVSVFLQSAPPVAAERKVASWFGEKAGQPYAEVRPAIEEAAQVALEARVPEELLVERLAEGAAKRVAPEVLRRAMEEEAGTLADLAALIDQRLPRLEAGVRTEALRLGAIAVRGGVETETVDRAVGWTIGESREVRRTMSALVAVAALRRVLGLDAPAQLAFAQALAGSSEKTSRFGSLVSLLSAARARGLSAETISAIALDALANGRSFLALQRELELRTPR